MDPLTSSFSFLQCSHGGTVRVSFAVLGGLGSWLSGLAHLLTYWLRESKTTGLFLLLLSGCQQQLLQLPVVSMTVGAAETSRQEMLLFPVSW